MANNLEFLISLSDKFSQRFSKVVGAASAGAVKVEQTTRKFEGMGNSIAGINAKIQLLENKRRSSTTSGEIRKLNGEIRTLERSATKLENLPPQGFLNRLRYSHDGLAGLAKTALKGYGIMQAWNGLKSFGSLGMEMEQTRAKFSVLMGTVEKGNAMIAKLNNMANVTPFENADLIGTAETLLAFNIAGEKIVPTMKMLGDVAMGDKTKLQGLSLAYAQMTSTGRLMGQDLLQMINQGFNPLVEIAKMTGKSLATLKKDMEKGAISAQMVEEAFKHATDEGGQFYKMMEKMSETGSGKLSTFLGKMKAKLTEFAERLNPFIVQVMNFGIAFVDNIEPLAQSVKGLFTAFSPIVEIIGHFASSLGIATSETGIAVGILTILAAVFNSLGAIIRTVTVGLATLAKFLIQNKIVLLSLITLLTVYKFVMWQSALATKGWTIASMLQYKWLVLTETAQKLLNTTISKFPFMFVVTAIASVVGILSSLKKKTQEAISSTDLLNQKSGEYAADERVRLDLIFDKLRQTNPKTQERNRLIKELREMYPGLLDSMNLEKVGLGELEAAYQKLMNVIDQKARARAYEDALVDLYKEKDIIEKEKVEELAFISSVINKGSLGWYKPGGLFEGNSVSVNGKDFKAKEAYQNYARLTKINSDINSIRSKTNFGTNGSGGMDTTLNPNTLNPTSAISDLASGGSKVQNVNITFKNLIENVSMYPQTIAEGIDKTADDLIEGMLRVVNSANAIATK